VCGVEAQQMLRDRFDLIHTTLQVDHEGGELVHIEMPEQRRSPQLFRDPDKRADALRPADAGGPAGGSDGD
jgi:hypothetical protein